jgi:hypothetical protein
MPIDRGIIDQQLQALGEGSRWWAQRELRDLPSVLDADEQIRALSRGKIARVRWFRRLWLIVVTDRRVLCLRSGGGTGWRQFEIRADHVTRAALRVGPFRGRVVVVAGDRTYRFLVPRLDAYKLVTALSTYAVARPDASRGFAPTRTFMRVVDHVLALPAAAFQPDAQRALPVVPDRSLLDQRIDSLEEEVQQLRQQVNFLEQLLHQRHES